MPDQTPPIVELREVTKHYQQGAVDVPALREEFRRPGFSCLDAVAGERLQALGLAGKSVAQLCCNNGREILSIESLGADPCVGFDQSAAFLAQVQAFLGAAPA